MPHAQTRLLLALVAAGTAAALWLAPRPAAAEQCPSNEPTAIRGRVVVDEPNKNPPGLRGIGEVFVYAYPVGRPDTGKRKIAVTDPKGHFCIHDTTAGKWVVTSAQPFQFRPFVRVLDCRAGSCDLGEIRIDTSLVRISDDYVNYQGSWWGGPYAQTITAPAGAESINAITFRSAGGSSPEIQVLEGKTISGNLLGRDTIDYPGNPGGSRETAFFEPGAVGVTPSQTYTVYFNGSGGVWRLGGDSYGGGRMFDAGGGSLSPMGDRDMCLTADVDGPDGRMTSHFSAGQNDAVRGSTVAQQFVARSEAITHVSVFVGTPKGNHRVRASIGETPDGPAIGGVRETGIIDQQPGAFAWAPGVVDVTPGKKYWVRFEFPGTHKAIYLDTNNPAGGPLWIDGRQKKGAFWGRVMGPKMAGSRPGWDGDAGGGTKMDAGSVPKMDAGNSRRRDSSTSPPDSRPARFDTRGGGRPDISIGPRPQFDTSGSGNAGDTASTTPGAETDEIDAAACGCTHNPEPGSLTGHLLLATLSLLGWRRRSGEIRR